MTYAYYTYAEVTYASLANYISRFAISFPAKCTSSCAKPMAELGRNRKLKKNFICHARSVSSSLITRSGTFACSLFHSQAQLPPNQKSIGARLSESVRTLKFVRLVGEA